MEPRRQLAECRVDRQRGDAHECAPLRARQDGPARVLHRVARSDRRTRPGAGPRSIPCAHAPRDVDRARHRPRGSRRGPAAHRPARAQPRGAPAAARPAARGRGPARPRRGPAHAPAPRSPRSAVAATGCARRPDHRPARGRATAAAARIPRGARGRDRRGDRRRRALGAGHRGPSPRRPRRDGRARACARVRDHGHAPHLSRGRHRPVRRHARHRCGRARPRTGADRGWGSRLGPGHLDPEGAARALALLQPRQAVPIHWGTYSVGPAARPPPAYVRAPLAKFLEAASELAPEVAVVPLEPGESLELRPA